MIIITFPREKITNEMFNILQDSQYYKIITWITNSSIRKSVKLKDWIKPQITSPSKGLLKVLETIPITDDYDRVVIDIFRWVRYNINYKSDYDIHKTPELWQEAALTEILRTGDCEDQAILIYVLCRLAGIPANRFEIIIGKARDETGLWFGHCWLSYKPQTMPLNRVFLDSSAYYDGRIIEDREKYYIYIDRIYNSNGSISDKYSFDSWFNEDYSSDRVRIDWNKILTT